MEKDNHDKSLEGIRILFKNLKVNGKDVRKASDDKNGIFDSEVE